MRCIFRTSLPKIIASEAAMLMVVALMWPSGTAGQAIASHGSEFEDKQGPSTSVQRDQADAFTCRFAKVAYPEGTVIRGDRVPEQMCVRAPNPSATGEGQSYHAEWIRISKEAHDRSSQIIDLPDSPDRSMTFFCQPATNTEKGDCGCEGSSGFAIGAMARSGKGAMECHEGGWRPLVSCVAQNREYPEGTVVRTGGSSEEMCARLLNLPLGTQSRETHLDWVRTNREIRERSTKPITVFLDPVLCKPAPPKNVGSGSCGCEGSSDFASHSIMQSADGPIRCEEGQWKPVPKSVPPK